MVVCFRIVKMLRPNIKLLDFLVKPQILASHGAGADCWSVRMTFYLDSYALHHCITVHCSELQMQCSVCSRMQMQCSVRSIIEGGLSPAADCYARLRATFPLREIRQVTVDYVADHFFVNTSQMYFSKSCNYDYNHN